MNKKEIRNKILGTSLEDILADLGSTLEVAHKNDDILASIALAADINSLNRIIDMFTEAEYEAEVEG